MGVLSWNLTGVVVILFYSSICIYSKRHISLFKETITHLQKNRLHPYVVRASVRPSPCKPRQILPRAEDAQPADGLAVRTQYGFKQSRDCAAVC